MAAQPQIIDYFRSLELALNEHKDKGTSQGDIIYLRIYGQLASDLAVLGIGRDQIPEFAKKCGHESTLKRLEQLMKKPIGFK
jgi:hypothetical protein